VRVDGGCHCGHVRYEAVVDPEKVAICHCTDCQTLSGSAYRTVVPAPAGEFRLLAGQPKVYVKTAESGNKRAQAFCPECGTPIYSAALTDTPAYFLRVGSIRQRAELPPKVQGWCRSALGWVMDIRDVPQNR
jgi:hypothetical protein